ncbi:MAG: ArsR/SmtB family transcription factor [Atopobiaceae bacterium]|jgi:ArsR family transcriptional regulator
MNRQVELTHLAQQIESSQKILTALGDETRQRLILAMLSHRGCSGMRVGEIAEKTALSRPAVSHHLQILKNARIIRVRKEGTKNYYSFDLDSLALDQLISTLAHAKSLMVSHEAESSRK